MKDLKDRENFFPPNFTSFISFFIVLNDAIICIFGY